MEEEVSGGSNNNCCFCCRCGTKLPFSPRCVAHVALEWSLFQAETFSLDQCASSWGFINSDRFKVNNKRERKRHKCMNRFPVLTNHHVAAVLWLFDIIRLSIGYRRFRPARGACLQQRQTRSVCLMNGKPDGLCCRLRWSGNLLNCSRQSASSHAGNGDS